MATGLTAGQGYSLSSSMNDKVSVVFVKLTDSSLRSIDEYHVAKVSFNTKEKNRNIIKYFK